MEGLRYLTDVTTLRLNPEICVGCGVCENVCPHGVFRVTNGTAEIVDLNGCMECGACANNCAVQAITVTPGVGCAAAIVQSWFKGKKGGGCGDSACC